MSEQHPGLLAPVDEPGDAELISAVRAGDVDAYGLLFERHVEAARRLARQLVSAGDADDLVSEAFAKVLAVLQRGGGPDLAFRAYLLTSIRRLHVDKIRGGARLQTTDDLTPYDPGVPFEDTAVAGFENATAAKAFASLPERWQQVLWHTEVEGQKPAEIAPLLGMTPNSVSALAYRAREGLRQAFVTMHAGDVVDDRCSTTRAHLGAYLRGGLSRRDSGKVEAHLQDCRPCSAIYLELSEVNADLGAVLAPLLLGSAGIGYLAAAHAGAIAAKGGLLLLLDRGKDWLLHNPVGRATGGVAAAAAAAVAVAAGVQLTGAPQQPAAAPDKPSASASPATTPPSSTQPPPVAPPSAPHRVPATTAPPASSPATAAPAAPAPSSQPAATNSAPVISTPLPNVELAPDGDSVVIDLTRGASDADGDTLKVKSARIRGAHPHGTVRKGGVAPRTTTPGRLPAGSLGRAPFGAAPAPVDRLGAGTITYRPDPSWRGTETIGYVLTDGQSTVAGTVKVITPNRRPVAAPDSRMVHAPAQPVEITVLANDTDANHDALTVTAVGAARGPLGGTAEPTPDGRAVRYTPGLFTPGAQFLGATTTFDYTVSDGHGGAATATVTVRYGNTAPTARPDTGAVRSEDDRWVVVDVLANDSDPDGDAIGLVGFTQPDNGTVVPNLGGLKYTPSGGFAGTDSFTYTIEDEFGGSATATVTVTTEKAVVTSAMSLSQHHVPVSYQGYHFTSAGIPDGMSATFDLTITGIAVLRETDWPESPHADPPPTPADCGNRPEPVDGVLVVHCTVSGNGDFLHVDFDANAGWTVDAKLTGVGFKDTGGDNEFHAKDTSVQDQRTMSSKSAQEHLSRPALDGSELAVSAPTNAPTASDASISTPDTFADALPFG